MRTTNKLFGSKLFCAALFIFFIFLISSCSKNRESSFRTKNSSSIDSQKPLIGFSIDTLAIERWQRELDIFMNAAKELGAEVIVQNAGNNTKTQNQQLSYLAEKNVDVVVLVPKEAEAHNDAIKTLRSKNIPVISYDRLVRNADINLYMTVDCEKVGYLMGEEMLKIAKSRNWIRILGPQEDYNVTLALNGFSQAISNSYVNIENTIYTPGWNYDFSRKRMEELVIEGKIPDVVICGNDSIATSVIHVLNQYKISKHVYICGQDGDITACQNIINGTQDFTIYKPITQLAEKTAEIAVKIALSDNQDAIRNLSDKTINNGFADIPTIAMEPVLVNKANIDKVIIESGFHSKNDIYR